MLLTEEGSFEKGKKEYTLIDATIPRDSQITEENVKETDF